MAKLTGELTPFNTLSGTISVFNGDLSKTQFERIWDQIVERIDSAEIPPITIIDSRLDAESSRPVENKVITTALDDLYRLFPTITVNGDSTNRTITIEDGADHIPLDNFIIEVIPSQSGSGTPSSENPRTFTKITTLGGLFFTEYDENNVPIDGGGSILTVSSTENVYGGILDLKAGVVHKYAYYSDYTGEYEIVGPWLSSKAEYDPNEDPPIGSQVIDLGTIENDCSLGKLAKDALTNLRTTTNKIVYTIYGDGDFSLTYRADPKAYTDLAVGLTSSQRQALIALLDDEE